MLGEMSSLATLFMDAVKAGEVSEVRIMLAKHGGAFKGVLDEVVPGGAFEETPAIAVKHGS